MPKYEDWMKSPDWLEFIRQLPCMSCGLRPSDAHHVTSRGMGLKQPDSMTVPLCRMCHSGLHDRNKPSVEWSRLALSRLWASLARELLEYSQSGTSRRVSKEIRPTPPPL